MNFKKEYEKAFSDISAGDEFKKQLVKEMKQKESVKTFPVRPVGMLAAAAALALMVGAVYVANVDSNAPGTKEQEQLVAEQSSPSDAKDLENGNSETDQKLDIDNQVLAQGNGENVYPQFDLKDSAWFGDLETDEDKVNKFAEICASDEVEALYSSPKKEFGETDKVDAAELALISDRIQEPAESPATTSDVQYYKVVLKSGKTIVFEVWDNSYIKIAGVESVYGLSR